MKRKPTTFLALMRTWGNDQALEISSDDDALREKYAAVEYEHAESIARGDCPVCVVLIVFDQHGQYMGEQFVREW